MVEYRKDYAIRTRKELDKQIKEVENQKNSETINIEASAEAKDHFRLRQERMNMVKTKLQEARMWLGKVLESEGHELPEDYKHEYEE